MNDQESKLQECEQRTAVNSSIQSAKKSPLQKKCADCNIIFPGNIIKNEQLKTLGLDEHQIRTCLYMCKHPMCDKCMRKTATRYSGDIGACDTCMWFAIG